MLNVNFLTLGCPKNEADTAAMRACIEASDYYLVEDSDDADIIVINTCAFIESATEESIEAILETAHEWLPQKEGRHILVTGCLPSRYGDDISSEMSEVSALLRVVDEQNICATIENLTGVPAHFDKSRCVAAVTAPYAYIKIADGCNKSCAYCTIPFIRGAYKSQPLDQILEEGRSLGEQGVSELILIAQDTTQYGSDLDTGETLVDVINALCELDSIERVRLMYLQPDGVTDELLATMAHQPKVAHYVEMPLQHSVRTILRTMNRNGEGAEFKALIEKIRNYMPDVVLRTTLIVGYPGETEDDFEDLLEFISDVEFDYVGVFPFSPEDGTQAALLGDLVEDDLKLERVQAVRDTADSIGWSRASARIGTEVDVLVEGITDGELYGRFYGQAPDIDGIVRLSSRADEHVTIGSWTKAKIFDSILYDLDGLM